MRVFSTFGSRHSHEVPMSTHDIAHRYSHGRVTRKLCADIGLVTPERHRAGMYYNPETRSTWFRWRGSDGDVYRHRFENGSADAMTEDELTALKIKVKLSLC